MLNDADAGVRIAALDTLADIGVESWRSEGRIGIWTRDIDGREAKIGAIGVRVRRWVTMHGFSVNLDPDLGHFAGSGQFVDDRISRRVHPGHDRAVRIGSMVQVLAHVLQAGGRLRETYVQGERHAQQPAGAVR